MRRESFPYATATTSSELTKWSINSVPDRAALGLKRSMHRHRVRPSKWTFRPAWTVRHFMCVSRPNAVRTRALTGGACRLYRLKMPSRSAWMWAVHPPVVVRVQMVVCKPGWPVPPVLRKPPLNSTNLMTRTRSFNLSVPRVLMMAWRSSICPRATMWWRRKPSLLAPRPIRPPIGKRITLICLPASRWVPLIWSQRRFPPAVPARVVSKSRCRKWRVCRILSTPLQIKVRLTHRFRRLRLVTRTLPTLSRECKPVTMS